MPPTATAAPTQANSALGTSTTSNAQATGGKNAQQVAPRPFRVGVQQQDDQAYDFTVTLNAGTQTLPLYQLPSNGFLNDTYILVQAGTAGNSAAVAYVADGPWTVIDSLTFNDTGNDPIIGPVNGYDLYVMNKYGGYAFNDDPKNLPIFSATTGSGSTGGSFAFLLVLPLEICPRDALGSLPNMYASTPYTVKCNVGANSAVYTTAPTAAPAVRVRMTPVSYWKPDASDAAGNPLSSQPPVVDTTAFWNVTPYAVNAGAMSPQLTSSVGYPIRNLVFVLRDNSGSRTQGEADFPDPFRLKVQANIIVDRIKALWQAYIARDFGYGAAISDATINAKDNGVYVLPFNKDFGPKPGWETRRGYLPTSDGMRFQALGTILGSGTHNLITYTNYVGIGGGQQLATIQA